MFKSFAGYNFVRKCSFCLSCHFFLVILGLKVLLFIVEIDSAFYKNMALPGVDEDCGCSIFVLCWNWWWRSCWWLLETGSTTSSSKISSDLFPARLDSLTRIRLWRLRWILWKVCKRKRRIFLYYFWSFRVCYNII